MFKDNKLDEDGALRKENEGQASLEKLIKLDCRDSNFLYRDQARNHYFRVHYPHTNTDLSGGQHLLKKFWLHIESHYFKKIEKEQLIRLNYLKSIFSQEIQSPIQNFNDQHFISLLHEVFADEVLVRMKSDQKSDMDMKNLVNRLFVIWKKSQIKMGIKQKKNLQKELTQSLKSFSNSKQKKKFQKCIEEEDKYLNQLLSSDLINRTLSQSKNQLDNQIQSLQKQIRQIFRINSKTLVKIQSFIESKSNIFIKQNEITQIRTSKKFAQSKDSQKCRRSQIQTVSQEIHNSFELDELQFIIKNLEERQLAQSMSKILECKKINGEYFYLVGFELALYLEPKLFEEKQLLKLNKMRETSMLQFYRTGTKSLYSYICQSYAGFGELSHNRQNLGKFKSTDIFQMMHKTANLTSESLATFNKFFTCHHCKFLYPDYLLKTCKFSSDRQALPKNNFQATLDPDFSQLGTGGFIAGCKSRVSQRFTTRKKNCLTGYAKINQEYVCGRKYCFSCLKDCYPNEIMNQSIFCPYCQGICQCSRCLRNQKIAKFKTAFSILGGDLLRLSLNSCIQKLQNKEETIQPKRRGRPKKYVKKLQHIAINKLNKKMRNSKDRDLKLNEIYRKRRVTLVTNKKEYESFSIIKQSEQKKSNVEAQVFELIATQTKKGKTSKKQFLIHQRIYQTLEKLSKSKEN